MKRRLLLLALLAGCAGAPPPRLAAPVPPERAPPLAAGAQRLRIAPEQSLIAITVRRGGPFARLGHDHVVASRALSGYVDPAAGQAEFEFRLDQMSVDEPELRRVAGLDTAPSAEAIAGTRANMLGRVLEADRFPLVRLHAGRLPADDGHLRLSITLHGVTRTVDVATRVEASAGRVVASGTLTLRQSDFGIAPLSIFRGALTVQDALELRFEIVALAPPAAAAPAAAAPAPG
jgi:polyisoprenoid-binding protein YceI